MRTSSILATILLLAGCQNPPATSPDSGIQLPDAGSQADAGPGCGDPGAPYGTSLGSNFRPFTLERCDGTPFAFYGEAEGFCDARFTVVAMAAGWCGPCRVEAQQMQALLVEAYEPEGVRVIVAITQDNDYRAPDADFCDGWVDQYGLTNPVVLDPAQETQIYFPAGALPAAVIVDSEGVIRHREYGVSTGLNTMRAALDRLLAE